MFSKSEVISRCNLIALHSLYRRADQNRRLGIKWGIKGVVCEGVERLTYVYQRSAIYSPYYHTECKKDTENWAQMTGGKGYLLTGEYCRAT